MLLQLFGVAAIPIVILTCSSFNIASVLMDLMQNITCPISVFNPNGGLLLVLLKDLGVDLHRYAAFTLLHQDV